VGFASQHFNGNIKYLYEEMDKNYKNIKIYFVTESGEELARLRGTNVEAHHSRDIRKILLFVKTKVWVTSHGPFYIPEYYLFSLSKKHKSKWVDLWHGTATLETAGSGRAKMLKYYDIGIVSSEYYKQYYSSKEDGILDKLKIIGFPRTDPLLDGSFHRDKIINHLDIPSHMKNILYAPTWGNPAAGENNEKKFFPFESDLKFLKDIESICTENRCNFIVRMHPNWEHDEKEYAERLINAIGESKNIFYLPFKEYPVTEPILYASDILVTDYSSIADDFILLGRPIIYLDVGIPKEKLVLSLKDRAGYIASSKIEFIVMLQNALDSPEQFREEFKDEISNLLGKLYMHSDGMSSQRCAEEIVRLLK